MNDAASEAPSRPTLSASLPGRDRDTASRRARTYGLVGETGDRRVDEGALDVDPGDGPHLGEDLPRILAGQIAHVDRHLAAVGHLVEGVAALDPAQVDRRPVEHL